MRGSPRQPGGGVADGGVMLLKKDIGTDMPFLPTRIIHREGGMWHQNRPSRTQHARRIARVWVFRAGTLPSVTEDRS